MPSVPGIYTSGEKQTPCIVTIDERGLRFDIIDNLGRAGRDEPEGEKHEHTTDSRNKLG
jgi:hypothetical protein